MEEPKFTYWRLLSRIKSMYGTVSAFADAIGYSYIPVLNRLNGKTPFVEHDMYIMLKALNVPLENAHLYFFETEV